MLDVDISPRLPISVAVTSRTFSQHAILREECARRFAQVKFNEQGVALKDEELVGFLSGADAAIVALEKFTPQILARLPALKILAKYGVGLDNLPVEVMQTQGIHLAWQGGVNRRSVAELTLGFMLGSLRNVLLSTRQMAKGVWKNFGGTDLSGKTVGILGCGHIGSEVLRLLQPFGCRLLVHDRLDKSLVAQQLAAKVVSLQELVANSEILSIHIPYEQSNHHLFDERLLRSMRPQSVLINTSRGGIVEEEALLKVLKEGHLAAAAMDVFAVEPATESPLLALDNFFATPHIGGSSREAILAMGRAAIENLATVFQRNQRGEKC